MKKKLFSIAKSPIGDVIIRQVFAHFSKLLPVKKLVNTKKVIAFYHPKPSCKIHILIVPKKAIKSIGLLGKTDSDYLNEVFLAARDLVEKLDLEKKGYSIITNGGKKQEVNQLHFHLVSGQ